MRRIPLLLALIVGLLACAPTHALAQNAPPTARAAQDDCDPADPNCDDLSSIINVVPADPATCPYGGLIVVWLGTPMPVCGGAPGAPAPPAPVAVGYDCAGKPVPPGGTPSLCPGTPGASGSLPAFLPAPSQVACGPSKRIINKLLGRYHEGNHVFVTVGGGRPIRMRVPEDNVLRFNLTGRACGLYAIIIRARGYKPLKLEYIAGPYGNITGINL